MSEPFRDHIHHLLAELQRVDDLIRQYVSRVRAGWQSDEYQGLFISEQEIDDLLHSPLLKPATSVEAADDQVTDPSEMARRLIGRRVVATEQAGIPLRLPRLIALFGLSPLDVDALLICLAVELDLRYERLYAYAQDDVTKKQPRVDLVLNVLCPHLTDRIAARTIFSPSGPLLRHGLLELTPEPGQGYTPLLGRFVHLQRRILDFMLGLDELDEKFLPFARCHSPTTTLDSLTLPEDSATRLGRILNRWQSTADTPAGDGRNEVLYLQGAYGAGRQAVAEAISQALGHRLLTVDIDRLRMQPDNLVPLIFREAMLQDAVLLLRSFDSCLGDDRDDVSLRQALLAAAKKHSGLILFSGDSDWEPRGQLGNRLFVRLRLAAPDYATRTELWQRSAGAIVGSTNAFSVQDLEPLANKFAFTPGQIRDAVMAARGLAAWREPSDAPSLEELYAAARSQSTPILSIMARKITPRFSWSDLVLVPDSLEILHEISNTIKNRHVVYGQWGFEKKLASGLGLNVLFAGESGTGKTMAADILARELGLDLYKIDLSGVVSKYIGETEKNLDRIFSEAKTSFAILFFDEADAIFGKRSEVRDSHDRYANIEISYLLQKMEEYDGVVILATNLRSNIDEAFVRRLHAAVDFPVPEADYRLRIWEVHFPDAAPRGDDLDLPFMAERFRITGGNIRNIVLGAAFLAAEQNAPIEMRHLVCAARRELQKMGRLVREIDFGPYYHLINGGDQRGS
jgi:hypothetical protein